MMRDRHDRTMTTSTTPKHPSAPDTPMPRRSGPETALRAVLTTNAATSGASGAVAMVLAGPVDSMLGTEATVWVRLVGAGLVAFAAVVLLIAHGPAGRLERVTPAVSAGDAAWVIGSIVTIALGWYSTGGAAVMAMVAAMVGTFGIAQAVLVHRLRSHDRVADRGVLAEHIDPAIF